MDKCIQIAALKGIPASDEGSNFVFSPLSLVVALSFAAEGAGGDTLEELLSFLDSPNLGHLHSTSRKLIQAGSTGDRELILSSINGAWVDRSMMINPSFMVVAASIYRARIESADFVSQASQELKNINSWGEENTNDIIKNLIPDNAVDCSTKLIFANALCFKGKLLKKFDSSMTKHDNFHLLNGSIVQAPFMTSTERQFISSYKDFKVLFLPYKNVGDGLENSSNYSMARVQNLQNKNEGGNLKNGSNFSMLLFLPNERDGLHDLMKRAAFDLNFFQEHIPFFAVEVCQLMVPKFKIAFNFEASNELKHLGLKTIFDPLGANLSGFCLESLQLPVSGIHHKAAIEVDEEGMSTTTATTSTFLTKSAAPKANFVADHPFMFVVIEDRNKSILLLGHVVNPSI